MDNGWLLVQQLQENINLIEDLLLQNGVDPEDRPFYQRMLEEQYEELAIAQRRQAAANTQVAGSHIDLEPPRLAQPVSPASSSGASRKRSIGHSATYPHSKRPSMNPSPATPNTPNSIASDVPGYSSSTAGPSRQQPHLQQTQPQFRASQANSHHDYQDRSHKQTLPYVSSRPAPSNVIDLTQSNPPTPDPFPELSSAFLRGAPQPIDAFQQEFMAEDELAQFLMEPTPAGASYAFHPALPVEQPVANPAYQPYDAHEVPLFVGNANTPWAPIDNEDEYGAPLTNDEAQAVENLLGNVSAHDAENAPERREQTPYKMTATSQLKEYQKIGLTWLMKV